MKLRARGLFYQILIFSLGALLSCSKPKHIFTPTKTYTVSLQTLHQTLNFTGSVQPLHATAVTSPINGLVESMQHRYGDKLNVGDPILTISSAELQKEFNNTLTDYLKAKENARLAQVKFNGTRDLWDAGILAKNVFLSEQSGLNSTRIALVQARMRLTELLEKLSEPALSNLKKLSFDTFHQVQTALSSPHNQIKIFAPCAGVLLYPPKTERSGTEQIHPGSSVKSGQVLAMMGDLSGIRLEINVPEVDLQLLHVGLPATIHGIAFDTHGLSGTLTAINAEALNDSTGGLVSFTAMVDVTELNPDQQQWIKVGMSASIELQIDTQQSLLVPITALTQNGNQHLVYVRNPSGKIEPRSVITGAVHDDQVVIQSGLQAGDIIVYD